MKRQFAKTLAPALVAAGFGLSAQAGGTYQLDLSGLAHGQVVSGTTINGVTINVDNFNTNNKHDLAVVFDSNERNTRDRDLEGYNGQDQQDWKTGNLQGVNVGNMLIIQEKNGGKVINGIHTRPDDEGRRPAGNLYFDFDQSVTSFGFDLIDVEGTAEFCRGSGFFATLTSGTEEFKVAFRDLIDSASAVYDATVEFGDNSANRIAAIEASTFGVESFDSVTLNFGGSAGVANINYTTEAVPTPSAVLGGLGLMAGALVRRRRQQGDTDAA